jgi:hypothetical protein
VWYRRKIGDYFLPELLVYYVIAGAVVKEEMLDYWS